MSTLIIAAHPDDEVLGCGGTMARLTAAGEDVHVVILGGRRTIQNTNRSEAEGALLEDLHANARSTNQLLGVQNVIIHDLPDNRFDTVPLLEIVKLIEAVVDRVQPRVIYTQHGGDLNIDHVITFRATLTATRPVRGCTVEAVYAYEVPSSTEWAFDSFAPAFKPNVFVDVASTLDAKIQAMAVYESESRDFPHPRSPQSIRAQARRWGSASGLDAAEAFELIRWVRATHV